MLNDERRKRDVIVIGASAGGVPALIELFSNLGALRQSQVAVVLHRSPVFEGRLADVLGRRSALPVVEPEDGAVWEPGRIYVAPRDRHMVVHTGGVLRLNRDAKQHHTGRRSIRCSSLSRAYTVPGLSAWSSPAWETTA